MESFPFSSKSFQTALIALLGLCLLFVVQYRPENHGEHHAALFARHDRPDSEAESYTSNVTLMRRDDYTCGPGKPCNNGACCGASGYCGYGTTYCGSGCVSNCEAVAECGVDASPSGKTCPLNTCCSQYGFCGTTQDFCTTNCQSNCVVNPSPPAGGSGQPMLNKVIGYYESWSARSTCHKIAPTDLPLDALTHVNFAFGSIDPTTYQVTTMDTATSPDLFQSVADLKSSKPDLKIFISIGGWTFSDNGTATQPLYGEIAADPGKRQSFADNVVRFMTQYGFDGLDIDWEYPGAPDRGGNPDDTKNYVSLLQTLRQTFDAGSRSLGLTFTAPSSYWYLRWFDLPGLIQYADWINLMSYDLHGLWDRDNPIGSIVQGHTNLTEIKLAASLFWRVNIPPGKIVMGFGFYGRSFTLANPSCSTPGCPFAGASNPGPCTASAGILSYYEIMDILNSASATKRSSNIKRAIQPTHDTASAVNYFTFDNNQWVSYDDAVTFKQKVDWANGVGLGGALIWASDLDDSKYSAHAGLLGRTIKSNAPLTPLSDTRLSSPQSVIQNLAGENGQQCTIEKSCQDLNKFQCANGLGIAGYDDAGCGKKNHHFGKPICCPVNAMPQNCIWRGGKSGDCNANCLAGEVNVQGFGSSWGGGFVNDGNTDKCGRGFKVFCCQADNWNQLKAGCEFSGCGYPCDPGFDTIYSIADSSNCNFFNPNRDYCCPSDTNRFTGCHWVKGGSGLDCSNAVCSATEVALDRDKFGDSQIGGCSWGRTKVNCCSLSSLPPKPITCAVNLCDTEPGYCPPSDGDDEAANSYKRDLEALDSDEDDEFMTLEKRAGGKAYNAVLSGGLSLRIIAAAYPSAGVLWQRLAGRRVLRRYFRLPIEDCPSTNIDEGIIPGGENPSVPPGTRWETEHPIDRSLIRRFINTGSTGVLQSGAFTRTRPIPNTFWQNAWNEAQASLNNLPSIGGGISPNVPNDRVFEAMGSRDNRGVLLFTDAQINGAKGRMFNLRVPTALETVRARATTAARTGRDEDAQLMLQHIRAALAVYSYLRVPDVTTAFNQVRGDIRNQLTIIENNVQGATGLSSMWDEFADDFFRYLASQSQNWMSDAIRVARTAFAQARDGNGNPPPNAAEVEAELSSLESKIQNAEVPPE